MAKVKLEAGTPLKVNHEIIDIYTGKTILAKGQCVTVREPIYTKGYWSRLCPDIYVKEKLSGIKLHEVSGAWSLNNFIIPPEYL